MGTNESKQPARLPKGSGANVPKLTKAFGSFYSKSSAANYDISDENFSFIDNVGIRSHPIFPVKQDAFDMQRRLTELCKSYSDKIFRLGEKLDDSSIEKKLIKLVKL